MRTWLLIHLLITCLALGNAIAKPPKQITPDEMFDSATKSAIKKKDLPSAIVAAEILSTLTGTDYSDKINELKTKLEASRLDAVIVAGIKSKNWDAVVDGYRLLCKIRSDKKCRQSEEKYTKIRDDARALKQYETAVFRMKVGVKAPNGLRISASKVEMKRSTGLHYTTGEWRFIYVLVVADNTSDTPCSVNPLNFTLTACSRDETVESDTYILSNYLPSIDLQPGSYTSGWLVFSARQSCSLTLNFQQYGDMVTKLPLAVKR